MLAISFLMSNSLWWQRSTMIQGEIKLLVNEKFRNFNAYCKNISKSRLRENLSLLQQCLNGVTDDSKQKYFLRLSQKKY